MDGIYLTFFTKPDGSRMPQDEFHKLAHDANYRADMLEVLAFCDDYKYHDHFLDLQDYIDLTFPGRITE